MGKRLRRLPSPSMGVAFIALLAALGGTAVALPGSNTVTTGDIKNSSVKTQDIKNSTVAGKDVKSNTLTGTDISESTLGKVPSATSADSATNATNATTAANATTLGGTAAAAHLRNYERVFVPAIPIIASSPDDITRIVTCPAGKKAIGGGGDILFAGGTLFAEQKEVVIAHSYPNTPTSWSTRALETDPIAANWTIRGYAICADG